MAHGARTPDENPLTLPSFVPPRRPSNQKLSTYSKVCFALGGVPYQMTENVIGFYLPIFLLDIVQLQAWEVSLVQFVGRAWDAITDPTVGFLVSRSPRTRLGRFMPCCGSCKVGWYLTFYCLFKMVLNVLHVPYASLTMFLSHKTEERDSATAYRMGVELFGILLGALVMSAFKVSDSKKCSMFNESNSSHQNNSISESSIQEKEAYKMAAIVVAVIYLVCIFLLFVGVRELKVSSPMTRRPSRQALPSQLHLMFTHQPYLKLTACYVFTSIAQQLLQGNMGIFFKHALHMANLFQYLVITVLVSAVICLPVCQWLLKVVSKTRMIMFGMLWWIPFLIALVTVPRNVPIAFIACAACGLTVATTSLIPWSMLPDTIMDFKRKYGDYPGQEALFYSFYVFFNKFAVGICLAISMLILDSVGYETCKDNTRSLELTLRLLMAPAPIIFGLIGISALICYKV
uniref:sodium-dependent lysophosphatidylcholine symporter 1-A-like isoform X2 n=1 Tax=Myxine glutinosa TaxID=7769 RepID=UPI00358E1129